MSNEHHDQWFLQNHKCLRNTTLSITVALLSYWGIFALLNSHLNHMLQLAVYWMKHKTMKMYDRVRLYDHAALTLALHWGKWSASHPAIPNRQEAWWIPQLVRYMRNIDLETSELVKNYNKSEHTHTLSLFSVDVKLGKIRWTMSCHFR
jgi:hypothetical protein